MDCGKFTWPISKYFFYLTYIVKFKVRMFDFALLLPMDVKLPWFIQ